MFKRRKMEIRTRSLLRSAISNTWPLCLLLWFIYTDLIRGIIATKRLDYLIFGNGYKNITTTILCLFALKLFCTFFYDNTLLPIYEAVIRKQVIDKKASIELVETWITSKHLPWKTTFVCISGEAGIYAYPGVLPDEIEDHRVKVIFLRRSLLVLEVTIIE